MWVGQKVSKEGNLKIQALSIKQPHASRVGLKIKGIEIRTWYVKHRGPILIVASMSHDPSFESLAVDGLPKGAAVAIVDILDCRRMKESDVEAAESDFDENSFSVIIGSSTPIFENIPVRGQLRIYEAEIPDAIYEQHLSGKGSIEKPVAGLQLSVEDWKKLLDAYDPDNEQDREIISLINEGIGTTRSRQKKVYIPMPTEEAFLALQICGQDGITFSVNPT